VRQIVLCLLVAVWSCIALVQAEEINLPVPHLLEYGADIGVYSGALTCGLCSLEMCAAYLQGRQAKFDNVKKINAYLEPSRAKDEHYLRHGKLTGWDELVRAAKDVYGFQGIATTNYSWNRVLEELRNQAPVILAIANYGAIPEREDKNYTGGHFLVVCGVSGDQAICQDPDHKQPKVKYPISHLNNAVGNWPMIIGFAPMKLEEQRLKDRENCWWLFFNYSVAKTNFPEAVIQEGRMELPAKIGGYSAEGYVVSADGRMWQGTIKLPSFCLEESQKPFLVLKGKFFHGEVTTLPIIGRGFIYQCWVVEQIGNHLLIIQRKVSYRVSIMLQPEDVKEVIDIVETFLRPPTADQTAWKNYFLIKSPRPSRYDHGIIVRKDEPAYLIDSVIYVHHDLSRAWWEFKLIEAGGQIRRLQLHVEDSQPPYPKKVTQAHIEKVRRVTFGY